MLNPRGSDGFAQAEAVAPRLAYVTAHLSVYVALAVLAMSVAALCLTVIAVSVRYDVVAVSPSGNIIPLVQLDSENEAAVRAQLDAGLAQVVPVPALPENEK